MILCNTPPDLCSGFAFAVKSGRFQRSHVNAEQAVECYRTFLLSEGYRQVGTREFMPVGGGRRDIVCLPVPVIKSPALVRRALAA